MRNRPKGTRKRYVQRLTRSEKKRILALTTAGVKQIEIARRFGCNVDTIRDVQKAAGIGRWVTLTPAIERECVALLRLGHGQARVAKMTRVPQKKIHELLAKYRIHHPTGDPGLRRKKPGILEKVDAAIKRRENYLVQIARRHDVSLWTVRRRAHELLGPGKFLSTWPPLESHMPQKWFEARMTGQHDEEETTLYILSTVARACFGGKLPEDQTRLIAIAIAACLLFFQREKPEVSLGPAEQLNAVDYFMPRFAGALETLRLAENGPVH